MRKSTFLKRVSNSTRNNSALQAREKRARDRYLQEPLDVCLDKSLLSEAGYRCCLHFRWLHSLLFGLARCKSNDFNQIRGRNCQILHEEAWYERKEREYRRAVEYLNNKNRRIAPAILEIALYKRCPSIIKDATNRDPVNKLGLMKRYWYDLELLNFLCEGAELLERLYCIRRKGFFNRI